MFDYAREVINKRIDDVYKKYSVQSATRQELSKKLLDISAFEQASYGLKSDKILFATSIIFLIGSLVCVFAFGPEILSILIGILALIKSIQYKGGIDFQKALLNQQTKQCLELVEEVLKDTDYFNDNNLELDRDALYLTREILEGKKNDIECEMRKTLDSIKEDKLMLQKFSDYEKTDKFFSCGSQLCIKQAKNEEEFNELIKQFDICNANSLDDFLEEKINYSDIHYENGVVGVKKLIKKF